MSTDIPSTADVAVEQTAGGAYRCPATDCTRVYGDTQSLIRHHRDEHETSIGEDVVGADAWFAFLEHEYIVLVNPAYDIARRLSPAFSKEYILAELRRLGLAGDVTNTPSHSSARVLELPHVRTIEQAREVARRRREAQP